MKWIVGTSVHSCWLGTYELNTQETVKPFIKPGMTVFDIGANAGFYTLAFSRLVGDRGKVWAFEPLAENVKSLLKHVMINQLRNVTVVQAAVSSEIGITGFQTSGHTCTGSLTEGGSYRVPTVSLDGSITQHGLPIPDLIKIDIEGSESSLLEGAKKLLEKKTTTLFISLHGDDQKKRCREILEAANYRILTLGGSELSNGQLIGNEIYAIPKLESSSALLQDENATAKYD